MRLLKERVDLMLLKMYCFSWDHLYDIINNDVYDVYCTGNTMTPLLLIWLLLATLPSHTSGTYYYTRRDRRDHRVEYL